MGLFGRKKKASKEAAAVEGASVNPNPNSASASSNSALQQQQQSAPPDTSVFEFGSSGYVGEDRITIAGYCPVSNDLEPCRWELLPAPGASDNAPLFRIIF